MRKTIANGRYEIIRRIGRGLSADVYLARDTQLLRFVAVKRLRGPERSSFDKMLREARLTTAVDHPNICAVFDVGGNVGGEVGEEDGPYIVMQYLRGGSLASLIAQGPVPVPLAISILIQVAEGLNAAHESGIVHGDLWPSNILVTESGLVKVLDFGLSRAMVAAPSKTRRANYWGALAYLAPEQLEGRASAASDIFSLGVTAYETFCGTNPFRKPRMAQATVMRRIATYDPAPPSSLRPDLPAGIDEIVARAIRKAPEDRWPRASAFGTELRQLAVALDLASELRDFPRALPAPLSEQKHRTGFLSFITETVLQRGQPPKTPASLSSDGDALAASLPAELLDDYASARALISQSTLRSGSRDGLETALRLLERVVNEAPGFAAAHLAIGVAHLHMVRNGFGGALHLQHAYDELRATLELDPADPEARIHMVYALLARGEKQRARQSIVELSRHERTAQSDLALALLLRLDGQYEAALRSLAGALFRDHSFAISIYNERARIRSYMGEIEMAMDELDKAEVLDPAHPVISATRGYLLLQKGQVGEAGALMENVFRKHGRLQIIRPTLAIAFLRAGDHERARQLMDEQTFRAAELDCEIAYRVATFYAAADQPENALMWMRKAVELGNENYPRFEGNPFWRSLRGNAEFEVLMRSLKAAHALNSRFWEEALPAIEEGANAKHAIRNAG